MLFFCFFAFFKISRVKIAIGGSDTKIKKKKSRVWIPKCLNQFHKSKVNNTGVGSESDSKGGGEDLCIQNS